MTIHRPYPYLDVRCHVHGREFAAPAYVDTGFDGGLVIPESEQVGMPDSHAITLIELGDASYTVGAEYVGRVSVGNRQFKASVLFLGNEYLLGREVVDQMRLCFHHGEYLEIED